MSDDVMKKAPGPGGASNRPLTVAQLKDLLRLADVAFGRTAKLADLRQLCEEHGLVERPPPEMKTVERICVVKCALRRADGSAIQGNAERVSAMNLDDAQFETFRAYVDKLVNVVSRMLRRASLALAFHVTRLLHVDLPVPDFYDMTDTYWKNWLRIAVDGVFPDAESEVTYRQIVLEKVLDPISEDEDVYVKEAPPFFDQVLNYAGHTLSTCVANNAWVPLFSRMVRLTKLKLKRWKAPKVITAYKVVRAIRTGEQSADGWPQAVVEYVADVRRALGAEPGTRMYDTYGAKEVTFPTLVRFNYEMLREFELLKARRSKILPIMRVGRAHVRLDLRVLVGSFRRLFPDDRAVAALAALDKEDHRDPDLYLLPERPEARRKKTSSEAEWTAHKLRLQAHADACDKVRAGAAYVKQRAKNDTHVSAQRAVAKSFFGRVPVKKGWTFDGSVSTDGVSVSLQFSRQERVPRAPKKKRAVEEAPLVVEEYDRGLETHVASLDALVLGVDPGRNNLAAVTYLWNGQRRRWSLTRGAFYQRSGVKELTLQQGKRFAEFGEAWAGLGLDGSALRTSKPAELLVYAGKYAAIANAWWRKALLRRESRANLKRYIGKRRVMDTFWASILRTVNKAFPNLAGSVHVAYGSGEAAVPTGAMFASCKRVFKHRVHVVSEFRSTMMQWETGTKKEMEYKTLSYDGAGRLQEELQHTSAKKPPRVPEQHTEAVLEYNARKAAQGKHRRGGGMAPWEPAEPPARMRALRYPEARGLRFSPEDGKYYDRDFQAALTIGRLWCMEVQGQGRPAPFAHT